MQAQQINTPLKYVKYCMYVQQFTLGVPPPQDNTMLYVSIVFDCLQCQSLLFVGDLCQVYIAKNHMWASLIEDF